MTWEQLHMIDMKSLSEMSSDVTASSDVRRISASLLAAMNDWPILNLDSLDDFLTALKSEIGELSKFNIRKKMKSSVTAAWKGESLVELLGAWGSADDEALLEDLIMRIRQR
ncbi:hypothetical protein LP420_34765 [Massilia sp. B-10]|nr:hypothetical protein LP420_34765 [Massilia sp. B-10]